MTNTTLPDGAIVPVGYSPSPDHVTRRQAMAVLIKYGLDADIAAMLSQQLSDATAAANAPAILAAKLALNDWHESQDFLRAWPLIEKVRLAKGWSADYVDALFREAASL